VRIRASKRMRKKSRPLGYWPNQGLFITPCFHYFLLSFSSYSCFFSFFTNHLAIQHWLCCVFTKKWRKKDKKRVSGVFRFVKEKKNVQLSRKQRRGRYRWPWHCVVIIATRPTSTNIYNLSVRCSCKFLNEISPRKHVCVDTQD
jgi:hypothetical protein